MIMNKERVNNYIVTCIVFFSKSDMMIQYTIICKNYFLMTFSFDVNFIYR